MKSILLIEDECRSSEFDRASAPCRFVALLRDHQWPAPWAPPGGLAQALPDLALVITALRTAR